MAEKATGTVSAFWSFGVDDEPLWDELGEERVVVQRCKECAAFVHPPTVACGNCLSTDLALAPVTGAGEVLAWTRMHLEYLEEWPPPYVVAAVRLDEGPILMCTVTEGATEVGARGRVVPHVAASSLAVYRFVDAGH
ncbi:MAG: hypothetical protein GEV10_18760 [Streptosporangiales bacterium]|nr:hypothetical protein [Streptosporangiales bacterium]